MSGNGATPDRRRADAAIWLGTLVIVGFFATLVGLFTLEIPDANRDLILTLAGMLGGMVTGVTGYYFGASKQAEHFARREPPPLTQSQIGGPP